jgi:3-mercaptopropionate dioxygenase
MSVSAASFIDLHEPLTRPAPNLARLRDFIGGLSALIERTSDENVILEEGEALLSALIAADDWLPDAFAEPHPEHYQQYLLHADSGERFSVVSFVWGPGQATPVHNHTVWGLVGILRGAEISERFRIANAGQTGSLLSPDGPNERLEAGKVDRVSPRIGDIHRVSNAYADRTSISIHVYGANIGAVSRSVFGLDGSRKPFISGYANTVLPNLWDRSKETPRSHL